MADFDAFNQALENATRQLDSFDLEPDPARKANLGQLRPGIDSLGELLAEWVLAPRAELEEQLDGEQQEQLREIVAEVAGKFAALLYLTDQSAEARKLLSDSRTLLAQGNQRRTLEEGISQPDAHVRLTHARWVSHSGDVDRARELARGLLELEAQAPAIANAARTLVDAPKPLDGVPLMFTLNGFGARMYGGHDPADDGSKTVVRYLVALFIPLLPIDAYRVFEYEDSYDFLSRAKLPGFARIWQLALGIGVVVLGLGGGGALWYNSPGHQLKVAIEEATKLEKAAADKPGRLAAIEHLEKLIYDSLEADEVAAEKLEPAAAAVMRLAAAEVPRPLRAKQVSMALAAIERFLALPGSVRGGDAGEQAATIVLGWAKELGKGERGALVRLLETGARVAPGGKLAEKRDTAREALAGELSPEWPIDAFRLYAASESAPGQAAAARLVKRLGVDSAVVRELTADLQLWATHAAKNTTGEVSRIAGSVASMVQSARAEGQLAERQELLESGTEPELRAALEKSPRDQDIAVSLARILMGDGEVKGALALIRSARPPGMLTIKSRLVLANVLTAAGQRPDAHRLLERTLSNLLGPYQAASSAYSEAANGLETKLVAKARAGDLPPGIDQKLRNASESEQRGVFADWLGEQIRADSELTRLRERAVALSGVVHLAVALATLELTHASEVSGTERKQLLAQAERHFLSVQLGASGLPSYHIGLGQVYHRLGKAKEGDAELNKLLSRKDSLLSLEVSRTYRELGLRKRATAVARQVYDKNDETHSSAAVLLSLLAVTTDDREKWLTKADPSIPFVKTGLLEIAAERLIDQGKLAEADETLARVAAEHERNSGTHSAAANNAALAYVRRYRCTGKEQHLVKATRLMDGALELTPNNALAMSNTVPILQQRAALSVLASRLDTGKLRLSAGQSALLLGALLSGTDQKRVRSDLARNPHYIRARELLKQTEVLAPREPDSWSSQVSVFSQLRDVDGLRSLLGRLERSPSLDVAAQHKAMADWLAGTHDKRSIQRAASSMAQLKQTLVRVRGTGSEAAVHLLIGDIEDDLTLLEAPLDHARASVASLRRAHELRPELGAARTLSRGLTTLALLASVADDQEKLNSVQAELRVWGPLLTLHRALSDSARAAVLKRRPEVTEAATLGVASARANPQPMDWVLGNAAGDDSLMQLGRASFDSPLVGTKSGIAMKMDPSKTVRAYAALLKRGAQGY